MIMVSVNKIGHIDHTNAYSVTVTDITGIQSYTVWTNRDGKGLWIDGQQVEGTAQFSAGNTPASASSAIRRYFSKRAAA